MIVFKPINEEFEKNHIKTSVKNIYASKGHWDSITTIKKYFDDIEMCYLDRDNFDKNIAIFGAKFLNQNKRITDAKFYNVEDEKKLILLVIADVRKFEDFDFLSREMSIQSKWHDINFSIVELLMQDEKDLKEGKKTLPENWKLNEAFTNKLNKLKYFIG